MRVGVGAPGGGVLGEDGALWLEGEVHEATPDFGRWLIARGRARIAPEVARRAEPPAPVAAEQEGAAPKRSTGRAGRRRGGK
jgi:hypothetical protein